ncbi:MAG: hypothetical protein AAF639_12530 [Chloroflexota bacterium]
MSKIIINEPSPKQNIVSLIASQPDDVSYHEFLNEFISMLIQQQNPAMPETQPIYEALHNGQTLLHDNSVNINGASDICNSVQATDSDVDELRRWYPTLVNVDDKTVRTLWEEGVLSLDAWADLPYDEREIPPQPEPPNFPDAPWDDLPYDESDFPQEPPRTPEGDKIALAAVEEIRNMFPPVDREYARYIAESHELSQDYQFELELETL